MSKTAAAAAAGDVSAAERASIAAVEKILQRKAAPPALVQSEHRPSVGGVSSSAISYPRYLHHPVRQTVVSHHEVPVVYERTVPVERDVVERSTRKHLVRGSRMVERIGHRQVPETHTEYRDEQVQGTRMVYKLVPETYTYVVQKPVTVSGTRLVPYSYYEPEAVDYYVNVPHETVRREHVHRVDRVLGSEAVAVEHEEVYEMRPHLVGATSPRATTAYHHHSAPLYTRHPAPLYTTAAPLHTTAHHSAPLYTHGHALLAAPTRVPSDLPVLASPSLSAAY